MKTSQEKEKQIKAALVTTGVNAVILLILLFAAAWSSPGSGEGEYPGIEVNLGYDEVGSGNIEPSTPIGEETATDDQNANAPDVSNEIPETPVEQSPLENTNASEVKPDNIVTDPTSDVEIKEPKKEEKPQVKSEVKEEPKKEEKSVEKPKEEPKKEEPKAVYKGGSTSGTSGTGDGKQGSAGNEGDDQGQTGNKGVPGGKEGAAVYKGNPGGGDGGTGLDLKGWDWDNIPKPTMPENETGRIVFEIRVNEDGELIGYKKESGTLSAAAERACVAALQKLTFTKKPGAKVPEVSVGKITFVVRSQ